MIEIYGYDKCTYCKKAVELLKRNGRPFNYYDIKDDQYKDKLQFIKEQGFTNVPQIFLDNNHLGGYEELYKVNELGLL